MSTDLKAIMDRDGRRRRMLSDPDLVGDALLFALALDEVLATRKEQGRRSTRPWVVDVAELMWGPATLSTRYRIRRVIGDDVPRFEPLHDPGSPCVAPMVRRKGLCGKRGSLSLVDRDPETGEARWIGLCARHRDMVTQFDARRKAWIANGEPSPPPNTGGVLKRYFQTNWAHLYQWAAPHRTPLDGAVEATPPRPTLRLVRDDEAPGGVS
ncbi:hypothetical protein [Amycolatopsis speibonae]|uniref:Uncharacterized protein n=1 Tax=Amycolatopsis speibonae TaxID=1450224 RepID=A0ABV7P661_9PSEU